MEVRPRVLLTAEEVAGLLGGRPPTVEEALRAERLGLRESRGGGARGREQRGGEGLNEVLRRAISGALHVAADAIYPSGRG